MNNELREKYWSLSETVGCLIGKEQDSYTLRPDFIYFWKTKANWWSNDVTNKHTNSRKKWFQRLVERYRINKWMNWYINKQINK